MTCYSEFLAAFDTLTYLQDASSASELSKSAVSKKASQEIVALGAAASSFICNMLSNVATSSTHFYEVLCCASVIAMKALRGGQTLCLLTDTINAREPQIMQLTDCRNMYRV